MPHRSERPPTGGRKAERLPVLDPGLRVTLLGAFELQLHGVPMAVPEKMQQLVAILAMEDRAVTRAALARMLWPDAADAQSRASLRSLLSRLPALLRDAIEVQGLDVRLHNKTEVDLRDARALAHRVLRYGAPRETDIGFAAIQALSDDLLPDWYEDWVQSESDLWRQLRVNALEEIAQALLNGHQFGQSADAAQRVIAAEPLRSTGPRALMAVHVAQGNNAEAYAVLQRYRALMSEEGDGLATDDIAALEELMRHAPASSIMRQAQTALAGEEAEEFEVIASGISMEPSVRHGDRLLVTKNVELEPGRIVVATHGDVWIVKRLALRDGELVLRSDNVDEEVALYDVEIRGVVVELHRTL